MELRDRSSFCKVFKLLTELSTTNENLHQENFPFLLLKRDIIFNPKPFRSKRGPNLKVKAAHGHKITSYSSRDDRYTVTVITR